MFLYYIGGERGHTKKGSEKEMRKLFGMIIFILSVIAMIISVVLFCRTISFIYVFYIVITVFLSLYLFPAKKREA